MLGTWIDLISVILIAVYFLVGWGQGFWRVVISFSAFWVGVLGAALSYALMAQSLALWFELTPAMANTIGFWLNFLILKYFTFFLLQHLVEKYLKQHSQEKGADRLRQIAGAPVGALYAATTMIFFLAIFLAMSLPSLASEEIERSNLGKAAEWTVNHTGGRLQTIFGGTWREVNFALQTLMTPPSGEKNELPFKVLDPQPRVDLEEAMLAKINTERTARNLKPLKMHERARAVARQYGAYLFAQGIFSHTDLAGRGPAERMQAAGITYTMAGENLALNATLDGAHQGLMESKGHRENILYPFFTRVGIGVIDGGEYGIIFVQEFLN